MGSALKNPGVPSPFSIVNGGTGAASTNAARANLDTMYRNLIANGDFRVAQRGTSFTNATVPLNSDGNYLLDNWILLSDGNNIVNVSQVITGQPIGAYSAMKSVVVTANKQWAFFSMLEVRDAAALIGGYCSLQFKAKTTTAKLINKLRCAILSWSSTADSPTKDVVGTWHGGGTDITPAANWTIENTPTDIGLTNAWQTFKVENVYIDTASAANIGVLIWVDDTDGATNDELFLADVQLEEGASCTHFERRPYQVELAMCQRYYECHGGAANAHPRASFYTAAAYINVSYLWAVNKRVLPNMAVVGNWTVANTAATAPSAIAYETHGYLLYMLPSGAGQFTWYPADATGFVTGSAELGV